MGAAGVTAPTVNSMQAPQKVNATTINVVWWSHLWVYSQRTENRILKGYLHTRVHRSFTHNSQDVEQPKYLMDESVNQVSSLCTLECYSALKQTEIHML